MPLITINVPDPDQAIDVWAECAHRYGIDATYLVNGDGYFEPNVDVVEADPTPPHGTERPTIDIVDFGTPRPVRPRDITCPHCGAKPGNYCKPPTGSSNYGTTFTHAARKLAAHDG